MRTAYNIQGGDWVTDILFMSPPSFGGSRMAKIIFLTAHHIQISKHNITLNIEHLVGASLT